MTSRLFVGNVPKSLSEDELKEAFSQYGQVINVDLKTKPGTENDSKFAFISLSAGNYEIESCIKFFSSQTLSGHKLYVTRARESFLERLQRERQETQKKEIEKIEHAECLLKQNPILKLGEKLNPRKRKIDDGSACKNLKAQNVEFNFDITCPEKSKKKQDSDKKRMESLLKKRQEFKQKQQIIKAGLVGIDKVSNKKIVFSENENECDTPPPTINVTVHEKSKLRDNKKKLFEDDESDGDINFEIKKQFEGVKGQKVLDLQSKYKSDKRFILDERFAEYDKSEEEDEKTIMNDDPIDLGDADEKTKQLNILEDLLGVPLKTKTVKTDSQKIKAKLGMLRFDPTQPEHAKFLAPVEGTTKQESVKKSKKKKNKDKLEEITTEENTTTENNKAKVEVSKEQFYKVSETLKEALEQKATFSLRSLFGQNETIEEEVAPKPKADFIPLQKLKEARVKNPLDTTTKNPFLYDSSDSETEEQDALKTVETIPKAAVAVWKENLFFTKLDSRLQAGLAFFNKTSESEVRKERRELKSVMKKRLYNKQRKNQMFQKKIGGRKKSFKKTHNKG